MNPVGRPGFTYFDVQTDRPDRKSGLYLLGLSREIKQGSKVGGGHLLCFKIGMTEAAESSIGMRHRAMSRAFEKWMGAKVKDTGEADGEADGDTLEMFWDAAKGGKLEGYLKKYFKRKDNLNQLLDTLGYTDIKGLTTIKKRQEALIKRLGQREGGSQIPTTNWQATFPDHTPGDQYYEIWEKVPGGGKEGTYVYDSKEFPGSVQVRKEPRWKGQRAKLYLPPLRDPNLGDVGARRTFWKMCIPEEGIIPLKRPKFELAWFWWLDREITGLAEKYVKQYFRHHTAQSYGLKGTPYGLTGNSEIILGVSFTVIYSVVQKAIRWAKRRRITPKLMGFKRCRTLGPWSVRTFPKWRDGTIEYDLKPVQTCPESEEDRFTKYEFEQMRLYEVQKKDVPLRVGFNRLRF